MRVIFVLLVLSAGLVSGCRKQASEPEANPLAATGQLLARLHFAGADRLSGDTNAPRLKTVWNLPETVTMREMALDKLARAPHEWLQKRLPDATGNFSDLIRPLLEDLIGAESHGEARETADQNVDWVLGVRLNAERAGVWQTNVATVAEAWSGKSARVSPIKGGGGWEILSPGGTVLVRLVRSGEWTLIGGGAGGVFAEWERKIRDTGSPAAADDKWLSAQVDWPRISARFPEAGRLGLPEVNLTIGSEEEYLRINSTLTFAEPFEWNPEPWRIPTNTIRDPLVSFTAVNGFSGFLKNQPEWAELASAGQLPDQMFVWALARIPFQTFAAFPVRNENDSLEPIAQRLVASHALNLAARGAGTLQWNVDKKELGWSGLPILTPFVYPIKEAAGEFWLTGIFPYTQLPNPPPAELLSQVMGRTNLVYYDWEVTEARLSQWRPLLQLFRFVFRLPAGGSESASYQWSQAIAPHLGNTVTEVTLTGASELTLTRKAHAGLTGFELMNLALWLESTNFPFGDFQLPPNESGGNIR